MKTEKELANRRNKWSFIKTSQEIIERNNNEQNPEDLDVAPLEQSDNLSEVDPDIIEAIISSPGP